MPSSVHDKAEAMREALARASSPLSSCQQRVWRLAETSPDLGFFERIGLRFSGAFRIAALDAALAEIVRRHAILRTVFLVLDGRPVQCVRSAARGGLLVVDLQALRPEQREHAATQLARRDRQPPFDLRRGPLMRAIVVRLSSRDHVLLMIFHHLIFDGWSRSVLFRELTMLFMAFSANVRPPLPELRVQYAEVARREQDPGTLPRRAARLAEWVERLAGLQPPATLPPDRPRTSRATHRAEIVPFQVPEASIRALWSVAKSEGVTLFMLGLTALAIALRASAVQQDEVTFGVPVANRTSTDAQALIGPFVNILPVRLRTPANSTVRDLLLDARTVMLDAFVYQEVPFDEVLEALYPGRPKGSYGPTDGDPVFRVCVDFSEHADGPLETQAQARSGLTVQPFETDDPIAGCDMFVSFSAASGRLGGIVLYNAELYERATVASFIDRFQSVLGSMDRSLHAQLTALMPEARCLMPETALIPEA
jgi:hypothetical protein